MSRRFGRNQKRAMRAQIAAVEKQNADLQYRNNECKVLMQLKDQRISILRETVDLTAQVLGEYFISLPIKTQEVMEIVDLLRLPAPETRGSYDEPSTQRRWQAVQQAVLHLELHRTDAHLDELQQCVHLRVHSVSGQVGFGLSDQAWLHTPVEVLQQLIIKEIAPAIAQKLIEIRKKGRRYHEIG